MTVFEDPSSWWWDPFARFGLKRCLDEEISVQISGEEERISLQALAYTPPNKKA